MDFSFSERIQRQVLTHDAVVQTPPQLDPTQWTGNQRVVHFGPMAQRDPFYYYYPKGWDILYPAHFGFFPYRTNKFRGSSPTVCLAAFGIFFSIGGIIMTYLGYAVLPGHEMGDEFELSNPLQITGPVLLVLGAISLIAGGIWWLCSLQLCSEHLRHTQPHHVSSRKKFVQSSPYEVSRSDSGHRSCLSSIAFRFSLQCLQEAWSRSHRTRRHLHRRFQSWRTSILRRRYTSSEEK